MSEVEEGKHILFVEDAPMPKTKVWAVASRYEEVLLGKVRWFGRWRKYGFYPEPGMVFEEDCLRDLAAFCERKTKEHREKP